MSKTKCFSYVRVSSRPQAGEDRDGFARQRAAINRLVGESDLYVVQEFSDALGGDNEWENRPGFSAMVDAIMSNGVRTVVIEDLTRLARAYVVQEMVLVFLASMGVSLISAATGENITESMQQDPTKKLLVQLQGVISEWQKNHLVRKLRAARQRKRAATGRCEGVLPFGAKPGEAETLATILRYHHQAGHGAQWIATRLNRDGVPTRKGGRWRSSTVGGILQRAREKRPKISCNS